MGKTLKSPLLLVITSVLLLNFSHASGKVIKIPLTRINQTIRDETSEQKVLDLIRIVHNLHSNDSHLSNIKEVKGHLWENPDIAVRQVVLGRTTCTRAKSEVEECAAKINLNLIEDNGEGMATYFKLDSGEETCREFQSELANCPFNEQADLQKTELCNYVIAFGTDDMFLTVIQFKCQSGFD